MLLKRVQGVSPPLFPLLPGTALLLVVPTYLCVVGLPFDEISTAWQRCDLSHFHILQATTMSSRVVGVDEYL